MKNRILPMLAVLLVAGAFVARAQNPPLDSTGSTAPAPTTDLPRTGCVTAQCHPGVKDHAFLHGPIRVNGCDGCHKLVDPALHRYELLGGPLEMCQLCHITEMGTAPYAHEPFVEGDCLSCHDPHGGTGSSLLRGRRYADACTKCHEDMTGAHAQVHDPASVGACGACHEPHEAQRPKLLKAEGRELCLGCHILTGIAIEAGPVVHDPALEDCLVCHDPHATDNKAMLTTNAQRLCTQCHEDVATAVNNASRQHEAVTSERSCLNCHSPHASSHPSLLREDVKQLCFECHNQSVTLPDGTHLPNMKQVIEGGTSLHGAITQRSCVECHEIHGGGHRRLLVNEYPSDLYYPFSESAYALCFSCHDRQLVMQPKTETATGFRNGSLNLHYVHVNRDNKGRSCRICHDAHAANRDKHIRDSVPFGPAGWNLPIDYESLPDGGRCGAGCHRSFAYNRVAPETYPEVEDDQSWRGDNLVPGSRIEPTEKPGGSSR
ncbi:MAG: hypothetical protein KDA22_05315 [Phycisphaerales bacterium]|nr:hypothetical protein [Phycisphaerales bacterium]